MNLHDAMNRCALYMELYERNAENLESKTPEAYRYFASRLMEMGKDPMNQRALGFIAGNYKTAKEVLENAKITERIIKNRMFFYPDLDELIDRLTAQKS